jgi:PKD repeat protein
MQAQGLSAAYHFWSGSRRNVFAEKTGTTYPDEIILITAHLDCMPSSGRAPGADDNASGSVGVMVAAEILKAFNFERTIRFVFFTGEEQGLLGSKAYAQKVSDDGDNIVAVYNMDMIAWDDIGLPVLRLHTRTPSNPGYAGDKAIADMFVDVVNIYSLDADLSPVIDADGISASDHSSFWSKGYSAILAIEDDEDDFNDYYHTVNDSLDKLNLAYFTNYVKASLGTVAHLAAPDNQGLNASFSYSADLLTVDFTDTSTCTECTVVDWDWDFGDGQSSTEQHPTHTYAADGIYIVTLTVTSNKSEIDSESKAITVGEVIEYCESSGGNQNYEWIAQVDVGALSNSSGASGYSDFTDQVVAMETGTTYAVTLTPGFAGSSYPEYWRIWADLNRDGDFEEPGELLFEGAGSGAVNGEINVQDTAATGSTRLRVTMRYGGYANPCGSFTYGEVEDYTLQFQ